MEIDAAIAALSALAQEVRLRAFRLLVTAGPAGLPAGRIADELGVPANTLSFHLSHLKAAGLVGCRRDGRSLVYSADYQRMQDLLGYLAENCCSRSACGEE